MLASTTSTTVARRPNKVRAVIQYAPLQATTNVLAQTIDFRPTRLPFGWVFQCRTGQYDPKLGFQRPFVMLGPKAQTLDDILIDFSDRQLSHGQGLPGAPFASKF